MPGAASLYVQDHSFAIIDRDAHTPFETMDFSTGIAGVMASAALVHAGIDRGYVQVSAAPVDHRPDLHTADQWAELTEWDDIAEFSLHVPNGTLTVEQLEYGPSDAQLTLPVLSPHGPGHYRIRIHASGRDRHYDKVADDSGERFHILAWPALPAAPLTVKASSWCGYSLRLGAVQRPARTEPLPPTPQEQADAAHQAMLHDALLAQRGPASPPTPTTRRGDNTQHRRAPGRQNPPA